MNGKRNLIMGLVGLLILGLDFSVKAEDVYEAWVARYNGAANSSDEASALAVDDSGNVYVTGYSNGSGIYEDYATIKYAPNGDTLWVRRYNGPADSTDLANAVAVDTNGNVYVSGRSIGSGTSYDYACIKYAPDGDTLWVRRYNGPTNSADWPSALSLDESGSVYVTGSSVGLQTAYDYATIKYTPDGDALWIRRYNALLNSTDKAYALAVDNSGNVYVTGATGASGYNYNFRYDYGTIKYAPNGDFLWLRHYNGPGDGYDWPSALAVDNVGYVYVTGSGAGLESPYDYATVKYTSNGDIVWARRYNGPDNGYDWPYALAIDNSGNVYVTGESGGSGSAYDYLTIKYAPNGDTLWVRRYSSPANYNDNACALAVDRSGNVYVTGTSHGSYDDYATIKYAPNGDTLWVRRYNGPVNNYDVVYALALDDSGNLYVTGGSVGRGTNYDYVTIKYSPCTTSSPKSGDANSDDSLSLADIVSMVNHIFGRGPRPYPPCDDNLNDCWVYNRFCRYDWNGDQKVTLGDCVRAINYIFSKPGFWNPVPSLGCCPFAHNQ